MVKKLSKILAYMLFFIFMLMVFIPKTSLYYLVEEKMKNFDIVISGEKLIEHIFWLEIQDLELSTKAIESASIKEVNIKIFFFYNTLHFSNIQLSSLVEVYLPSKVEELEVRYTIFNPLSIQIEGSGEFGEVDASFDILDRNLSVRLHPSNMMLKRYKKSMKMFKKSQEGAYVYAKSF